MSTVSSVRLSFVPRSNQHKKHKSKINSRYELKSSTKTISPSQVSPLAVSTQSIALDGSSQNRLMTMPEKELQELSSSFPLTGNTNELKSITKNPIEGESKNKTCSWLRLASVLGIIATIIGLAALGMSIYTLVATPAKTSTTTTASTAPTLRWNTNGITVAGTGVLGTAANQLNGPLGLVLYSSNILYISDQNNSRVQKWDKNAWVGVTVAGQANATPGSTSAFLDKASGLAVDSTGSVYVIDMYNCRVQYWPAGATTGTLVAGNGTCGTANNQLDHPYGMTRDSSSGTLYIADTNNHRVMRYLVGASSGTVVAGGNGNGTGNTHLDYPAGLYLDSSSNSLLIANAGANNIVRWTFGATSWTLVVGDLNGAIGSTSTMLHYPVGVTLDQWGNIYVADTYNHRIQFFSAGGQSGTTIAGIGGIAGSNATLLNNPYTVLLDDNYNLYVSDGNNHRIQKFLYY